MDVYITHKSGELTTSGTELRERALVGRVDIGRLHMDFTKFEDFFNANQGGVTVEDSSNVMLISGGRKSITEALRNFPLILRPGPAGSLSFSVIRQDIVLPPSQKVGRAELVVNIPRVAIGHGMAHSGVKQKFTMMGKIAAGLVETAVRTSKKFTFLQIYSGAPQAGDRAVQGGHAAVTTLALANQLSGIAGWLDG